LVEYFDYLSLEIHLLLELLDCPVELGNDEWFLDVHFQLMLIYQSSFKLRSIFYVILYVVRNHLYFHSLFIIFQQHLISYLKNLDYSSAELHLVQIHFSIGFTFERLVFSCQRIYFAIQSKKYCLLSDYLVGLLHSFNWITQLVQTRPFHKQDYLHHQWGYTHPFGLDYLFRYLRLFIQVHWMHRSLYHFENFMSGLQIIDCLWISLDL